MAALPGPSQIAGKHYALYDAYFNQLEKTPAGMISAMEGAKFLKRSGLSDAILSKIWDLSDPQGKGALDKSGLFLSLKLITLAQSGKDVSLANAMLDIVELPEMTGEKPVISDNLIDPPMQQPKPFDLAPEELATYRKLFQGVVDSGQTHVPGAKAKGLMLESKLSIDVLGKIWDLADTDRDGALDECEFIIALHLVKMAKTGQVLPAALPKDAINLLRQRMNGGVSVAPPLPRPPSVASLVSSPPAAMPLVPPPPMSVAPVSVADMPSVIPVSKPPEQPIMVSAAPPIIPAAVAPVAPVQQSQWYISPEDRVKFAQLFTQTDKDSDGFVSGVEIKDVFLQSGVPQPMLAHIWNLCDIQQQGKLTREQFTFAMFLIQRKVQQDLDPPQILPQELLMPPEQGGMPQDNAQESNAEFELIMKEITELSNEKQHLEYEIISKESEKKIKNGELKSLQSEYDTLAATLKQLENQKNIALTRLSDLETQVNTLRDQAESQESTLIQQELELSQKATELQTLDIELVNNEKEQKEAQNEIEKLTDIKQQTQLKISKLRTQLTDLQELENTMKTCLIKYDESIENGNVYSVTETELRDLGIEIFEIVEAVSEAKTPVKSPEATFQDQFTMDNQQQQDVGGHEEDWSGGFSLGIGNANAPTAGFDSSPFEGGGFEPAAATAASAGSFDSDPFAALRPETQPEWPINQPRPVSSDPFAPAVTPVPAKSPMGFEKDPFGADPFASGGGGGGAPNLPPKKPPPPRPAPPKAAPARPPPPKASSAATTPQPQSDPFGGSENTFEVDFANFDQAQFSFGSSINNNNNNFGGGFSPWGETASTTTSTTLNNGRRSKSSASNKFSTISSSSRHNNNNHNANSFFNTTSSSRSSRNLEFSEDPFKNYRYEDPFALSVDPFLSSNNNSFPDNKSDPFK